MAIMTFLNDLKFALRSLARSKGLAITVILTLALGIGANAAIFGVVRGVLLRPLTNRDENRLIYIRQSAQGLGTENAGFSVPEILDLKAGIKTPSENGAFPTNGLTTCCIDTDRCPRNTACRDSTGCSPVPRPIRFSLMRLAVRSLVGA